MNTFDTEIQFQPVLPIGGLLSFGSSPSDCLAGVPLNY